MKGLISIEIKDSFNKKDIPIEKTEMLSIYSTKGQEINNPVIVNSQTILSSTSNQLQNNNFTKILPTGKSLTREIFVGAIGTMIGAIITYLIVGIK